MMTLGDLVSATDINVGKKRSNFLSGKGGWCEAAGNRFLSVIKFLSFMHISTSLLAPLCGDLIGRLFKDNQSHPSQTIVPN